jgi:hypothetical protein
LFVPNGLELDLAELWVLVGVGCSWGQGMVVVPKKSGTRGATGVVKGYCGTNARWQRLSAETAGDRWLMLLHIVMCLEDATAFDKSHHVGVFHLSHH